MRRLVALLVLALPAPAQAAPVCGPPTAETMATSALTRVYVRSDEVYACTRGVRRRRHLGTTYCYGSSSGCSTVDRVAVAGRMVAYAINSYDGSGAAWFDLTVRDVRSGRRIEWHSSPYGRVHTFVEGVAVRQSGAAAWLWQRQRVDGGPRVRLVSRSGRCGEPTVVARGDLAPDTLWRDGARVFWREGGADRSAPLC